jgi:adenylyl- and sulfurtransferase ThiI
MKRKKYVDILKREPTPFVKKMASNIRMTFHKEPKQKLVYRNFHITINTNKLNTPEVFDGLTGYIESMADGWFVDEEGSGEIQDLEMEVARELNKRNQLHAHILVKTRARGAGVRLRYNTMRDRLTDLLGQNAYLRVDLIPDRTTAVSNYIQKEPISGPTAE